MASSHSSASGQFPKHEAPRKLPGSGSSDAELTSGKGEKKISGIQIKHGYNLVKGKVNHPMEDRHVAEYKHVGEHEVGLFAIYDGHAGSTVADYLKEHLFNCILKKDEFFSQTTTKDVLERVYKETDDKILALEAELGSGGSTAVTAFIISGTNSVRLVVANVGDSRAVLSKKLVAEQLSIDHEPRGDRHMIEEKGGFVSNIPGDVPRVDGQLAVARAFGDPNLKVHLSSMPHVYQGIIDENVELLILASDGLWKVIANQEAVDLVKDVEDPEAAAKVLTDAAVAKKSRDDISCIVVRFIK